MKSHERAGQQHSKIMDFKRNEPVKILSKQEQEQKIIEQKVEAFKNELLRSNTQTEDKKKETPKSISK